MTSEAEVAGRALKDTELARTSELAEHQLRSMKRQQQHLRELRELMVGSLDQSGSTFLGAVEAMSTDSGAGSPRGVLNSTGIDGLGSAGSRGTSLGQSVGSRPPLWSSRRMPSGVTTGSTAPDSAAVGEEAEPSALSKHVGSISSQLHFSTKDCMQISSRSDVASVGAGILETEIQQEMVVSHQSSQTDNANLAESPQRQEVAWAEMEARYVEAQNEVKAFVTDSTARLQSLSELQESHQSCARELSDATASAESARQQAVAVEEACEGVIREEAARMAAQECQFAQELSQAAAAESSAEQRALTWQRRWESYQTERRTLEAEIREAGLRHASQAGRMTHFEQAEHSAQASLEAFEHRCWDLEMTCEAAVEASERAICKQASAMDSRNQECRLELQERSSLRREVAEKDSLIERSRAECFHLERICEDQRRADRAAALELEAELAQSREGANVLARTTTREIESQRSRCDTLEAEVSDMEAEMAQRCREVVAFRAAAAELEAQRSRCAALEAEVKSERGFAHAFESQASGLLCARAEVEELRAELAVSREAAVCQERQRQSDSSAVAEMQALLETAAARSERELLQNQALRSELLILEQQASEASVAHAACMGQQRMQLASTANLEELLADSQVAAAAYARQQGFLRARLLESEQSLGEANTRLSELEDVVADSQEAVTSYARQQGVLRAKLHVHEQHFSEDVDQQRSALHGQSPVMQDQSFQSAATAAPHPGQSDRLRARIVELEGQLAESLAQRERGTRQRGQLQRQVDQLQAQLSEAACAEAVGFTAILQGSGHGVIRHPQSESPQSSAPT